MTATNSDHELRAGCRTPLQDWLHPYRPDTKRKLVRLAQHWELQLQELAMYLLLYTEAANLRHLPECLWFMFWAMRNSRVKMGEVRRFRSLHACCVMFCA